MSESVRATELASVRARTREVILESVDADGPVLVEAPPNSRKTTSSYKLVHEAETPVSYLTERTDLYSQAEDWAAEEPGVVAKRIPAPHRNCRTFKGANDGEQAKAQQLYRKGLTGAKIHRLDSVYTPCFDGDSSESKCDYMRKRKEIQSGLSDGTIDLLIGNQQHAHKEDYIQDRIVVLDEFNPDPFLQRYPSEGGVQDADHPGAIVSHFLTGLSEADEEFPTDSFADIEDIVAGREESDALDAALSWFEETGVTRSDVVDLDWYEVTSYRYNAAHRAGPLLTLALFCLRRIGDGIELAPPPEEYGLPRLREAWRQSGLQENVRCIRNRNTGEVHLLRPPDLSTAEQVIGLDGLPSKRLWDVVFTSGPEFDHRQVIPRDEYSAYVSSALNMTVVQTGRGRYPYATGRTSDDDEYRFAVIQGLEGQRFPLISTKQALADYENRGWMDRFVKPAPEKFPEDGDFPEYAAMNYGRILSSNVFEDEEFGVVSGVPHPGYRPIRIWAGLCGAAIEIPEENEAPDFEGVADEVYRYFTVHRVMQALLRFGREDSVIESDGSTVYVNTTALPGWFAPSWTFEVSKETRFTEMLEYLIGATWSEERRPLPEQNVKSLREALGTSEAQDEDLRGWLRDLAAAGLVTTSDRGKHGSTLYQWDADAALSEVDLKEFSHCLPVGDKVHLLDL